MPESEFTLVSRIEEEPEPTEEDLQRWRDLQFRMDEDRRLAVEAGEKLPPITVDLWRTTD